MTQSLKIIFAGTPDFSVPILQALIDSPHSVLAVYTQPDRPAGRGQKLIASPVKQLAQQQQITIEQPVTLRDLSAQQTLANYAPDVMIVAAYGLLLPESVLAIPTHGCINVHASLLPRWRGAAPIQRAILAGDQETGVTIMQMAKGLDTGDMLLKKSCPITANMNAQVLHNQLATMGAGALLETLDLLLEKKLQPEIQDDTQANYAKKIEKAEARIDWNNTAQEIDRLIRAYNPWPVAFTQLDDAIIRIWQAEPIQQTSAAPAGTIINLAMNAILVACKENVISIRQLQFPNGKIISAQDAINAKRVKIGASFQSSFI